MSCHLMGGRDAFSGFFKHHYSKNHVKIFTMSLLLLKYAALKTSRGSPCQKPTIIMRISNNVSVAWKQLHLWAGLWSSCESQLSRLSQPMMVCYRLFYELQSETSSLNPGCRRHSLHWKCVSALPQGTSTASAGCLFDLLIAKRNKNPLCPRSRGTKWWPTTPKRLFRCVLWALLSGVHDSKWLQTRSKLGGVELWRHQTSVSSSR